MISVALLLFPGLGLALLGCKTVAELTLLQTSAIILWLRRLLLMRGPQLESTGYRTLGTMKVTFLTYI